MNNNTTNKKTLGEKMKESFMIAVMAAGIVLVVLLLIWVPLKLIPAIFSNGSKFVATTLTSTFMPATTTEVANTQPTNTANNQNTTTNSSNVNHVVTTKAPAVYYYGNPDLAISIISTGIIDPATKQFVQTSYVGSANEIGIRFQVKNIGTNVSGPWKLRINAPSRTTPYFDSGYQTSIKPNDRMIFTASFDSPLNAGVNTTYITVDPLNMIMETNESNNQIVVPINVQGTNYTYGNNYNYGSNTPVPNLPYGSLYTWTNINANCYANPQTSYQGSPVTWYVSANGGNGYFTYSWTGSDNLYSNDTVVNKTYYSAGMKNASVVVTSGGNSVTFQCSANIY